MCSPLRLCQFAFTEVSLIGRRRWRAGVCTARRKEKAFPPCHDGRTTRVDCSLLPSHPVEQASEASSAGCILSRRLAALTVASTALGFPFPMPVLAETGPLPGACLPRQYDADVPLGVVLYSDPAGRFRLVRPCGWTQVTSLAPDSTVLASFYNPEEPGAETLAVYLAAAPAGVQATQQLGSAQDVATALAGIAPNGLVIDARNWTHEGREYILEHVQFGGNTAGMFGAAREFRGITIAQGMQYTVRLTTTRYRYLAYSQMKQMMEAILESFEVLV